MEKRRVVVTGAGVVSALGGSRAELFEALLAGRCAVRRMPEWSAELLGVPLAAPVELDPEIAKRINRKFRRSMGPAALFASLAALQAAEESGLDAELLGSGRTGCAVSSTMGSSSSIVEATALLLSGRREEMPATQFFKCASHSSAFNVANLLGINGVQLSPCSACASGLQSVGAAMEQIQLGKQDVMLAGGSDEATPAVAGSFEQLFALAGGDVEPERASRPFDADRRGLVCGEGAGILVLEEYGHAVRRGAPLLLELTGYATNCSGVHVSQSDAVSIERCLKLALADAGLEPAGIDYVSAHATATVAGDREEAAALRNVFGGGVPVSSLKGHLGHTLGASGAIELAAVCEMARRGVVVPTLNLERVGAECAGLDLPVAPREKRIGVFAKCCIAFGGVNAVLIGKKLS